MRPYALPELIAGEQAGDGCAAKAFGRASRFGVVSVLARVTRAALRAIAARIFVGHLAEEVGEASSKTARLCHRIVISGRRQPRYTGAAIGLVTRAEAPAEGPLRCRS
jgi:hypothetical protein